jgi:hypothetical protein
LTNVVVFFEDAKATGMVSAPHESKSRPPKAYELARQLGVPPRAVVAAARALNLPVQNRLTRLIPAHVDAIIAISANPRRKPEQTSPPTPANNPSLPANTPKESRA